MIPTYGRVLSAIEKSLQELVEKYQGIRRSLQDLVEEYSPINKNWGCDGAEIEFEEKLIGQ